MSVVIPHFLCLSGGDAGKFDRRLESLTEGWKVVNSSMARAPLMVWKRSPETSRCGNLRDVAVLWRVSHDFFRMLWERGNVHRYMGIFVSENARMDTGKAIYLS